MERVLDNFASRSIRIGINVKCLFAFLFEKYLRAERADLWKMKPKGLLQGCGRRESSGSWDALGDDKCCNVDRSECRTFTHHRRYLPGLGVWTVMRSTEIKGIFGGGGIQRFQWSCCPVLSSRSVCVRLISGYTSLCHWRCTATALACGVGYKARVTFRVFNVQKRP